MSSGACRAAFEEAEVFKRAETLDNAFPECACEIWSLTQGNGPGVQSEEVVARILTSPDSYDENTSTIITQKLTQIYSLGMSIIRQGASDQEIIDTVTDLLGNAQEARKLVGAVVIGVEKLRSYANDDDNRRWFGVYATDDRGKSHHGDVLGLTVKKKEQQRRRYKLAEDMAPLIIEAIDQLDLIAKLRAAGI